MVNIKKRRYLTPTVVAILTILAFVLAACARTPAQSSPAPSSPEPTPTPMMTEIEEGKALYAQKCAVCHGPNGEGTALGPKVAGHSASAVKTQLRNPVGTMPAFTQAQLGDADANKVAVFIASLEPAMARPLEWEAAAPETMHHWMALLAIKTNDTADARHHLEDVLALIKEPVHETQTREALDLINQGKLHYAEHEIEEMAGGESPSGVTMQRFHLVLAMDGVKEQNAAMVKHHLEHFLIEATEEQKVIAGKALQLIQAADFHEAEHEIEELLKG